MSNDFSWPTVIAGLSAAFAANDVPPNDGINNAAVRLLLSACDCYVTGQCELFRARVGELFSHLKISEHPFIQPFVPFLVALEAQRTNWEAMRVAQKHQSSEPNKPAEGYCP